jgi:hypothetical protein
VTTTAVTRMPGSSGPTAWLSTVDRVKGRRIVLVVLGVLLVLVGVLWTLQGVGLVGGSVMSGVTLWAIVGPVVALGGVLLLVVARR